jgi:hypothetical protein
MKRKAFLVFFLGFIVSLVFGQNTASSQIFKITNFARIPKDRTDEVEICKIVQESGVIIITVYEKGKAQNAPYFTYTLSNYNSGKKYYARVEENGEVWSWDPIGRLTFTSDGFHFEMGDDEETVVELDGTLMRQ